MISSVFMYTFRIDDVTWFWNFIIFIVINIIYEYKISQDLLGQVLW